MNQASSVETRTRLSTQLESNVSTKRTDDQDELASLFNAIAKSIADTSDEEILEDVHAAGEDADAIAAEAAAVIANAIKEVKLQRRLEAQQRRAGRIARLKEQGSAVPLPPTPALRRVGAVESQMPSVYCRD
jgi:hypothetical protein